MSNAIYGWIATCCGTVALLAGIWLQWLPMPVAAGEKSPLMARYLALAIHIAATVLLAGFAVVRIMQIEINGPWLSLMHIRQLWVAASLSAAAFYGSVHLVHRFLGVRWPGWQRILGCMIAGPGLVALGVGIRIVS